MTRQELIKSIEAYAEASGFAPATVCQYAIQHRSFYDNIKGGGDFRYATALRLLEWIDSNKDRVSKRRRKIDSAPAP